MLWYENTTTTATRGAFHTLQPLFEILLDEALVTSETIFKISFTIFQADLHSAAVQPQPAPTIIHDACHKDLNLKQSSLWGPTG